jgi:glyoxylase-like metal-dependent hydrolase (beta-lactamase superfamily II)
VLGLECFPTPGHASHHVSYLASDGTLYAGDAAGVRIQPDRVVLPPTPPPDFDLEIWSRTLEEIERRNPARLALIHFGIATDVKQHLDQLRDRLSTWTRRVGDGSTEEDFSRDARKDIAESNADVDVYEGAMPFWQSYAGLKRYWEKRERGD